MINICDQIKLALMLDPAHIAVIVFQHGSAQAQGPLACAAYSSIVDWGRLLELKNPKQGLLFGAFLPNVQEKQQPMQQKLI
jgi:threonine/homoserine/homoserine lactone efflux protein